MTIARQPALTLDDNLTQHLACAQALLGLLAQERSALLTQDVSALEQVSEAKAAAAGTLEALSKKLVALCGGTPDSVIRAKGGAVLSQWQALLQLAASCQQENLGNGALLQEQQTRVRSTLQLLRRDAKPLYGRSGPQAPHLDKRQLARA